ncbi:MAG: response regulator [Armatimonadota bacterium]
MRILVVDDEEAVRTAVRRRLEREGHTVDEAENEADAAAKIQASDPSYDIVVTDMVMNSEQGGVEVLKSAVGRDIFTEVIVLTAYGNVANAVECMKLGAFDYVEKNIPGVDVYDLLAMKVEQALQRRRAALATLRRADQILKVTSRSAE